ncbi:MAG: hypothetical protein AB1499_06130 [Nitrospirota bacterium]
MTIIRATHQTEISAILDRIHDRFFVVEDIVFDPESRCLRIPLSVIDDKGNLSRKIFFLKKLTHDILAAELIIKNVIDYKIEDISQTGKGDINTIVLDEDNLVIKCGLPVTVTIKVSELLLELIVSDKVVGQKSFWN